MWRLMGDEDKATPKEGTAQKQKSNIIIQLHSV